MWKKFKKFPCESSPNWVSHDFSSIQIILDMWEKTSYVTRENPYYFFTVHWLCSDKREQCAMVSSWWVMWMLVLFVSNLLFLSCKKAGRTKNLRDRPKLNKFQILWNLLCRISGVSIEIIDARGLSERPQIHRFSSSASPITAPCLTWLRLGQRPVPLFYIPDDE